jgi:hypothetical protein
MASDDEARAVLDGLTTYGHDRRLVGPGNIADIVRLIRKAKTEALMKAAEVAAEAEVARCKDGEDDGVATRSNCVVAIFDLAAKLEGGTDGL